MGNRLSIISRKIINILPKSGRLWEIWARFQQFSGGFRNPREIWRPFVKVRKSTPPSNTLYLVNLDNFQPDFDAQPVWEQPLSVSPTTRDTSYSLYYYYGLMAYQPTAASVLKNCNPA